MYTIDVPKKEQPYCLSGLVRSVSWFFNIETNKNLQNTAVSHVVYFLLEWRRSKWQRVGGETAGFMFLLSVILPISCPPAVICSVLCCSLCSLSCHCVCCHSPVSPCLSSVSSSDSGAWIPSPAQRSELQSLPAAAGHRHPLWGHQTVSFTVPACQ